MNFNLQGTSRSCGNIDSSNRKEGLHVNQKHSYIDFNCLEKIYCSKMLCDVALVAEGREVQAHKLILALCSPFIYWKLSSNRKSRQLDRIEIQNVKYDTLSTVINYLYTSEIVITEENVGDLLAAAYMFALRDLQEACRNFLQENLSPQNCFRFNTIAIHCQCEPLTQIIDEYVDAHFVEVIKHDEYLALPHEQFLKLISRDGLSTTEEHVLECVIRWGRYDIQQRKDYIFSLMEHVRFPLISQKNILQQLEGEQWLKSDSRYNGLLVEIFKYFILKGQTTFPTEPRLSSKVLVAVGYTGDSLNVEIFDFQTNVWMDLPIMFKLKPETFPRLTTIVGTNFYFIDDRKMKAIDICNPAKICSEYKQFSENREYYGFATLNNCIYAVGGYFNQLLAATAERFDISSGQWKPITDMPEARCAVGLCPMSGFLYAVGGQKSPYLDVDNSVKYYKPDTDSWCSVPNMSIKRFLPGVASLGEYLYVVGGGDTGESFKNVEMFDSTECSWNQLPDMNVARIAPGVITLNGLLYVIGGYNNDSKYLKSVEMYDPNSNQWSLLPSMSSGKRDVAVALIDKAKLTF